MARDQQRTNKAHGFWSWSCEPSVDPSDLITTCVSGVTVATDNLFRDQALNSPFVVDTDSGWLVQAVAQFVSVCAIILDLWL